MEFLQSTLSFITFPRISSRSNTKCSDIFCGCTICHPLGKFKTTNMSPAATTSNSTNTTLKNQKVSREISTISSLIDKFRESHENPKSAKSQSKYYSTFKMKNSEMSHESFVPCGGYDSFYENPSIRNFQQRDDDAANNNLEPDSYHNDYYSTQNSDYGYSSLELSIPEPKDDLEIRNNQGLIVPPPRRKRRGRHSDHKFSKNNIAEIIKSDDETNIYEDISKENSDYEDISYDKTNYISHKADVIMIQPPLGTSSIKLKYSDQFLNKEIENIISNRNNNNKCKSGCSILDIISLETEQNNNSKNLDNFNSHNSTYSNYNNDKNITKIIENKIYYKTYDDLRRDSNINNNNGGSGSGGNCHIKNIAPENDDDIEEIIVCESTVRIVNSQLKSEKAADSELTVETTTTPPPPIDSTYTRLYSESLYEDQDDKKSMSSFDTQYEQIACLKSTENHNNYYYTNLMRSPFTKWKRQAIKRINSNSLVREQ